MPLHWTVISAVWFSGDRSFGQQGDAGAPRVRLAAVSFISYLYGSDSLMLIFKNFAVCGFISLSSVVFGFILPARAGYTGNVEVQVTSLKNVKGQVCLSIFSGPKGFPAGGKGSNLKAARCVPAKNGSVTFANLPLGTYAIAAIHDIDNKGKLTVNALGIPTGGFGFSNNPPLRFGPASFAESVILVSGTKTVVKIQMRYLN